MSKTTGLRQRDESAELRLLQKELREERREHEDQKRQLERYASDLRETFKAERAKAEELRASYVAFVRALANFIEARDPYTGAHAQRVTAYGLELTRRIDPGLAANPQVEFGFLLHDVGKVGVPDSILTKAERLAEEEKVLMRLHPEKGAKLVRDIPSLDEAAEIVRHHHERWDGSGYPDGLAGEDIPRPARIFAVVDTLDAMTTNRPYSPAAPLAQARAEIRGMAGSQFDPAVVEALDRIPDETLERIRTQGG